MSDKYALLNERQREAVFHTEGPLLILAGAGSGKTRVLTHRIAYLIEEKGVPAYNIMAITFTNKAAEEMKNRVLALAEDGDAVWVATFHASCVRILRRFIDFLGYGTDFTIYDADDQKTVVRHVIKDLNLDPKLYKERSLVSYISDCKTAMMTPNDMIRMASEFIEEKYAEIYEAYEARLRKNNALDFDDLLIKTVELFRKNPEVLSYYQRRFRYIMVDEYQDTNHVQFEFVRLLSESHHNLCVVGDDDQSIYRFRGADIRNILDFEKSFPGTKVVKLEQNYRSTTHILDAANAVIRNNRGRKEKRLWSALGEGQTVEFCLYESGFSEAQEIVMKIQREVLSGRAAYRDFAVLYRTNAQSRLFEEKCVNLNVPYTLVGGVNFYQREEVKDVLAYLKTIANGRDNVATQRILNKPRRGIGDATLNKLLAFAAAKDLSLMETIEHAYEVPGLSGGTLDKLRVFSHLIGELRDLAGVVGDRTERLTFDELINAVLEKAHYDEVLDEYDEDKQEQKRGNIAEMISKAADFEQNWDGEDDPALVDFLEEVALVADVDSLSDDDNKLVLMTLHAAKGLEFPTVFLAGMEDGLFPSSMALSEGDPMAVEEERRLCYVGITRAMRRLFLSAASSRMVNGSTQYNKVSRFVEEIPEEMLKSTGRTQPEAGKSGRNPGWGWGQYGWGGTSRPGGASVGAGGPDYGREFKVEKLTTLDYAVGDRVRHIKFGEGTVLEIIEGKRDFEVRVAFDTAGEKRMYASFAKLIRI